MKFDKLLQENARPAWVEKYVDYHTLKKLIKHIKEANEKHKAKTGSWSLLSPKAQDAEDKPISAIMEEMEKKIVVNTNKDEEMTDPIEQVKMITEVDFASSFKAEDFPTDEIYQAEHEFMDKLSQQMFKVSTFYAEQCQYFAHQMEQVITRAKKVQEEEERLKSKKNKKDNGETELNLESKVEDKVKTVMTAMTMKEVRAEKRRLRRLYREEHYAIHVDLASYRILNAMALLKITKKRDKNSFKKGLKALCFKKIESSNFRSDYFERACLSQLEKSYAELFQITDRNNAMTELQKQPPAIDFESNSCWFGFSLGCSAAFFLVLFF
ncbi:hypothetical protein RFI_27509, partial [Reticulomyxa filosa]